MDGRTEFVDTFASLDRARLSRMDQAARSSQLDAREMVRHYVEALWQDVQRSGENPEIGDKYTALALVRELTRSLTNVAFDATHDGKSTVHESGG
jgi:hypothetical protein